MFMHNAGHIYGSEYKKTIVPFPPHFHTYFDSLVDIAIDGYVDRGYFVQNRVFYLDGHCHYRV